MYTIHFSYVPQIGTKRVQERLQANPNMATGNVEIIAEKIDVLNRVTKLLPFEVSGEASPKEELRLRHRVLDLRRTKMRDNLVLRHRVARAFRAFLEKMDHSWQM